MTEELKYKFKLDFEFGDCTFEQFADKCHKNLQMVKDIMLAEVVAQLEGDDASISFAKFLLGMGADIDAKFGTYSVMSIASGDIRIDEPDYDFCEFLVKNGANINTVGYFGSTPLLDAARYGNLDYIKLLVEKGADVNAIEQKYDELDKEGYYSSVLSNACRSSSLEIVKYLVEKGAKINRIDPSDETALINACQHWRSADRSAEIVKYLLEMGADVTIGDREGLTALAHAKIKGHKEAEKLLLEHIRKTDK